MVSSPRRPWATGWLLAALCALTCGCQIHRQFHDQIPAAPVPRELEKLSLPEYVVEPPDILLVEALSLIPKPPYHIQPLDTLGIQALNAFPEAPIQGLYAVAPEGTVNLGATYGTVQVAGMTIEEAQAAVEAHLAQILAEPQVAVTLAQSRAMQQIAGEHLVRPDGTISLGTYGAVYVTGMTLKEARAAIEGHLSEFVQDPEISVDVFAYNSKVYYVISDGGGSGESHVRLPITGNETVLDAVSQVGGLSGVSSTKIWIARPTPACTDCAQILPVDWPAIVRYGQTDTNYQLMPGDRLFIESDPFVRLDTLIAKVTAPFTRALGTASFTYIFLRQANVGVSGGGGFGGGGGGGGGGIF
jgi:protein involved in polysaccharide export with SLBB domain